jgi:hypothetical protein
MKTICAVFALFLCAAAPARAANIVVNPGFETGANDFNCAVTAGWSSNIWCLGLLGVPPTSHSGIGAAGGSNPAEFLSQMWMSQSLATVAGTTYNLSFWAAMTSATTITNIVIEWDGVEVEHFIDPITSVCAFDSPSSTYTCDWIQLIVPNLTASAGSTLLKILGSQDQGLLMLDDFVVEAAEAQAAPVPEPASLALMGSGLAALAARYRRRRR